MSNTEKFILAISSDLPQMGKDTLAGAGVKSLPPCPYQTFSFAHVLKQEVCKHFNLDFDKMMSDPAYKSEYRDKLISYSNDKRAENPDVWVNHVIEQLDKYFAEPPILDNFRRIARCAAITDVRYQNEVDRLREKYESDTCKVRHVHITVTDINIMRARFRQQNPEYSDTQWRNYLLLLDDVSERELQTFHLYIPPATRDDVNTYVVEKYKRPIFKPDFLLYNDYSLYMYLSQADTFFKQCRLTYNLVEYVMGNK